MINFQLANATLSVRWMRSAIQWAANAPVNPALAEGRAVLVSQAMEISRRVVSSVNATLSEAIRSYVIPIRDIACAKTVFLEGIAISVKTFTTDFRCRAVNVGRKNEQISLLDNCSEFYLELYLSFTTDASYLYI